ncbi:RNA-guided endonuclease InsQ/TnpB family protein [Celeribacter halophilus]|uniref:RNA-guided endonuclease InsQ/TnpB family protein n=1 Tax=Celeribacter halophilus TaxID=576117 RepID=UPI003A8CF328
MIQRGYRYKLKPTPAQERLFAQCAGVCRLIYNLALEQRRDHWRAFKRQTGSSISYPSQARELTELRAEYDWIATVSQTCQQQALRDLDRAYQNWFKGIASYPSPRKKGRNDTFRFQGREVRVRKLNGTWSEVRLPKIGWVRFRDTRPLRGKVNNATISLAPNGWHVSFTLAIEHDAPANIAPEVGVDRGVANTLALSTGERISVPASLAALERRQRTAQRVLSRRKRGSKRYAKARARVSALSARRARIRKDWHHRVSLDLARRFGTVVLEDLNTKGMTASARGTVDEPGRNVRQKAGLNRSILNQGWHIFEALLSYKLEERGGELIKVPARHTSQTCSACGAVDSRSRKSQAHFVCTSCGHFENADTNAAKMILRRNTASMLVEEGHRVSVEARTIGEAKSQTGNLRPSGRGRRVVITFLPAKSPLLHAERIPKNSSYVAKQLLPFL